MGLQLLDRLQIKRRAGKENVPLSCTFGQRHEIRYGQLPAFAGAQRRTLGKNFGGKKIGNTEQLELHGIATASRRRVDEGKRPDQVLRVIAGDFGDKHGSQSNASDAYQASYSTAMPAPKDYMSKEMFMGEGSAIGAETATPSLDWNGHTGPSIARVKEYDIIA